MNILLVINEQKDPEYILANHVSDLINNRAKLFVDEKYRIADLRNVKKLDKNLDKNQYSEIDIILVMGGDGTLLSVAGIAAELGIPVVGINLGRLGFLTEIEVDKLEDGLDRLLAGDYVTEERMMLCAELLNGKKTVALNDVVVTRANSTLKILDMDIFIDREYVDDFKADGIIIATPTGSTAYSLSAGGPIVDPSLNSMIVTPICPHKMYSRTIIVPPDKIVTVKCRAAADNDAIVAADSEILGKLSEDESVVVRIAQKKLKLIRFTGYKFFSVLHNKLVKKES